jgi:hypothetical protein
VGGGGGAPKMTYIAHFHLKLNLISVLKSSSSNNWYKKRTSEQTNNGIFKVAQPKQENDQCFESGFYQISGSGSGIRIQGGKNDLKK